MDCYQYLARLALCTEALGTESSDSHFQTDYAFPFHNFAKTEAATEYCADSAVEQVKGAVTEAKWKEQRQQDDLLQSKNTKGKRRFPPALPASSHEWRMLSFKEEGRFVLQMVHNKQPGLRAIREGGRLKLSLHPHAQTEEEEKEKQIDEENMDTQYQIQMQTQTQKKKKKKAMESTEILMLSVRPPLPHVVHCLFWYSTFSAAAVAAAWLPLASYSIYALGLGRRSSGPSSSTDEYILIAALACMPFCMIMKLEEPCSNLSLLSLPGACAEASEMDRLFVLSPMGGEQAGKEYE